MSKTLDAHIEITPGVCGGKPRIAGHRITVQNVAIWHDRLGWSPDEIAAEYGLEMADVYAALTYYHDHRNEIERSIQEDQEFVDLMRRSQPSPLQEKLRRMKRDSGSHGANQPVS
jgi:uncharacterized protein (DUF433 family)